MTSRPSALEKLGFVFLDDIKLQNQKTIEFEISVTKENETEAFITKTNGSNLLITNLIMLYCEFLKHLTIRDLIILSRTCSTLRTFLFIKKSCFYDSIKTNFQSLLTILKNIKIFLNLEDDAINISGSLVPYLLYGKFPIYKNAPMIKEKYMCGEWIDNYLEFIKTPHDIDLIIKHTKKKNINEKYIEFVNNGSHFEPKTMDNVSSKFPFYIFTENTSIYKPQSHIEQEFIDIIELKENCTIFDHINTYDISCCKNLMTYDLKNQKIDFILHEDTMKNEFSYDKDTSISRIQKYTVRGFIPKKKELTYYDNIYHQKIIWKYDSETNIITKKSKNEKRLFLD